MIKIEVKTQNLTLKNNKIDKSVWNFDNKRFLNKILVLKAQNLTLKWKKLK